MKNYRKNITVSMVIKNHIEYWVDKKYLGFFWFPYKVITKLEYDRFSLESLI